MNIKEKVENWIRETLKIERVDLTHPKDLKNGDYSFFNHSTATANDVAQKLSESKIPEVEKVEMVGKFVNVYLSREFFAKAVREINKEGEKCGENDLFKDQKIIIEYTDPNPFKEFHIGHLMSNTIGESISRIIERQGAEVKRACYQGDVGLHVATAVFGLLEKEKEGSGLTVLEGKEIDQHILKGVQLSAEAYSTISKERMNVGELFKQKEEKIKEINEKIYNKSDQQVNKIYELGKKYSLEYFEMLYKKLGTKFDFYFFESEVGEEGKKVVLEFLEKGVFEESDGAVVFRGEKYDPKLHTRVFVNSQGLPVYEAKELALAKIKYERYKYDKSIVITGNEINEYFKVLLTAMKEVFPELAHKTEHLSHGMMKLPTGKMSSRTGDVITAESLIEQVKGKVLDKIKDREFSEKEKEDLAEIVAIGAIKYSILRQAIGGDIIFDFEKSISFEGDSGPYLQYTAVRAKSVLEKSKSETPNPKQIQNSKFEIQNLERYLYRFPEIVERAGKEYAPHYIVTYLTELAGMFNNFYAKERIVDENDPTSPYKIALTAATFYILKSGLHLLGIKVPERM